MRLRVHCPAKINTFLSVGAPGIGGYHPIRTTMQAVSLADEMDIEVSERASIECNLALPQENTITKVLRLLNDLMDVPSLKIRLTKQIPMESGLGGGSSDAAGLIRAIAFLTGISVDQHLMDVASAVGKDVPFFLVGGRAKAEGFGDLVQPLEDGPKEWLALVKPSAGVSSGAAYKALDSSERPFRDFPPHFWSGFNDFMDVAPPICHDILTELASQGAHSAGLSGSGSAVWGKFEDEESAIRAASFWNQTPDTKAYACATLSRVESLLLERVA